MAIRSSAHFAQGDGSIEVPEVLDPWNSSVTAVPGTFTLATRTDYFLGDKDGRSIELPGKAYMAIGIERLKE